MSERRFPLILSPEERKAGAPTSMPWALAERAYVVYCDRYSGGGQTLERVAQRGGFYTGEMDLFIPGWRQELGL
ncbi:hypothetical protein [Corallococcus exiguus]|uniref:Uncharacterized protein n=1 Tax=Corallococcus exiguus TaxID=83462 RepID=A0A7X4Y7P2_9BACT|nr:hypothetical protein [Corallococcus exiguus]NBC40458.1 hypothetical protein [Corallococcus exiguus]TNV64059.1 hypothetical protein FH620_13550 [Corallococcus exiguus]